MLGLQGIWDEDFPALQEGKAGLLREIAGNAFTGTVAMAVLLGAPVHGVSRASDAPPPGSDDGLSGVTSDDCLPESGESGTSGSGEPQ